MRAREGDRRKKTQRRQLLAVGVAEEYNDRSREKRRQNAWLGESN